MYENLDINEYIKRMQEWDDKKNSKVQDWIEENWIPGETFTYPNGVIIQYRNFKDRSDLNGIKKN